MFALFELSLPVGFGGGGVEIGVDSRFAMRAVNLEVIDPSISDAISSFVRDGVATLADAVGGLSGNFPPFSLTALAFGQSRTP